MRLALFILICLTIAIGGLLSFDPKFAHKPSWCRAHLDAIKEDLRDIGIHLVRFKKEKGRYPTNDEGLLALDGLKTKWSLTCEQLDELSAGEIEELQKKHGLGYFELYDRQMGTRGMALRRRDAPYQAASEAGIMSLWDIPYIYENRHGLPEEAFKDSPATLDTDRSYSIQVDDGVFVYSIGSELVYEEYKLLQWEKRFVRTLTISLLVVLVLLFFVFKPRRQKAEKRLKVVTVVGAVAAISASAFVAWVPTGVMCYAMAFFRKEGRRPQMLARYEQLLEKYHKAGVISDKTYSTAREALKRDFKPEPPVEEKPGESG